jgi:hypothetical protein
MQRWGGIVVVAGALGCVVGPEPTGGGSGDSGGDGIGDASAGGTSGATTSSSDSSASATTSAGPTTGDPSGGDTSTGSSTTDDDPTASFDLGALPDLGGIDTSDCDVNAVSDTLAFTFSHQFDTGFTDATLQASYYNGDDDEVMIMSYYGEARRFSLDGTPLGEVFDVPPEAMPALDGATYDPVEQVGLLINQGCVLTTVEPQTLEVIATQQLGFGMSICAGIAIGVDGNLYIASYGTDEMVTITRDGMTEIARVATLPGIDGIALIAGSENFLVMSTYPLPAQAAIIDASGQEVVSAATLGAVMPPLMGGAPSSVDAVLTLCGNGHAWVCDEYGATCLDFAPDDGDKNACACLGVPQG